MDKGKDKFVGQFIHLFNKSLLSWRYVPNTARGPEASMVNKIQSLPSGRMSCCRE